MGEIKIKSGNLVESYVADNNKNRYIAVLYAEADLKPSTTYTIALTINEGYDVYFNEKVFSNWSAFTGDGTYQVFALTTRSDLTKNNNTYTSGKGWWILKNNKYQANFINVSDFQILEGTYTSETIPEYQPYFLNRPAHRYTNGEWIDIPTHKYTNGRWQGELTSQSPLRFRADGEMLDWRIEGKTSGNLFDLNMFYATASRANITVEKTNTGLKLVKNTDGDAYIQNYYSQGDTSKLFNVKPNTTYTLSVQNETPITMFVTVYNTDETVYLYRGYANSNTATFDTGSDGRYLRVRFGNNASMETGEEYVLSNIMLNKGETALPYEPYGGVGDYDETEQKYKIPIWVEGKNLFDGEWKQGTILSPSSAIRVSNKNVISLKPNTVYTIGVRGSSIIQYALVYRDKDGNATYDSGWFSTASPVLSPISDGATAEILIRRSDAGSISPVSEEVLSLKVIFVEGTYTASTIPLYETTLYTDHQLMDGDSIDFTTDQTAIPITQGDNTLTVGTAVQPSKVFVKFEG